MQSADEIVDMGQFSAVDTKTHQHLLGNCAPADIDVPQKSLMSSFVIDADTVMVYIIHNQRFDLVGFCRQNMALFVFHHLMGACPVETGKGFALMAGNRILRLVAVAVAGGGRQNGNFLQLFAANAV